MMNFRPRSNKLYWSLLAHLGLLTAFLVLAAPSNAGVVRLPVPNVTLYPGDLLSEDVLSSRRFKSSAAARAPVALEASQVIGKVARRTLLRGKPIALHALREPYLVKKGNPVKVVYVAGGLVITTYATSLKSGALGDLIQARNSDSGKIITGVVGGDGSLLMRQP